VMNRVAGGTAKAGREASLLATSILRRANENRTLILLTASAVLMGAFVGRALVFGRLEIAFLVPLAVFGVALLFDLSLYGWCVLLLTTTVAVRGPVYWLGLPQILNFLHYPLTLAFVVASLNRPLTHSGGVARSTRWVVGLTAIVIVAMTANLSHPVRAAFFFLVVSEPLLILWGIRRWRSEPGTERKLLRFVVLLAIVQIPIALWQGLSFGFSDPVQGTLTGHGAGHHVLGALFSLLLLVIVAAVIARRINAVSGLLLGIVTIGMMLAPQPLAVVILTGVALAIMPLLVRHPGVAENTRGINLGRIILVLLLSAGALYLVGLAVPNVYERLSRLADPSTFPEVQIMLERLENKPSQVVFGSGPGTSASRASTLLTGQGEFEEGSPLGFLNLPPTDIGLELRGRTRDPFGGSAEDFRSSSLAFFGDLGIVGWIGLMIFLFQLWVETGRAKTWLGFAARAAVLLVSLMIFVDNWLEYPEFSVPFAMLIGFALAEPWSAGRYSVAFGRLHRHASIGSLSQ
jgi:hypothetical protein